MDNPALVGTMSVDVDAYRKRRRESTSATWSTSYIHVVNLRRARLVLEWVTVSGFSTVPGARHLSRYVGDCPSLCG